MYVCINKAWHYSRVPQVYDCCPWSSAIALPHLPDLLAFNNDGHLFHNRVAPAIDQPAALQVDGLTLREAEAKQEETKHYLLSHRGPFTVS
jgi:hypothetical protein